MSSTHAVSAFRILGSKPPAPIQFERNNIDSIRLGLASIVALFHIFSISGIATLAPYAKYFDAHAAVKAFFVISGMLVYRSYIRSSSSRSYFEKRLRRIYPAYFVVVTLAALSLSWLSTLPPWQYFGTGFWRYLAANLAFLNHLAPSLPGVFQNHPETAVDGALWTLKIEVLFYLFVPVMHSLAKKIGLNQMLISLAVPSYVWHCFFQGLAGKPLWGTGIRVMPTLYEQFPGQLFYFLAGVFLLCHFDKLKNRMSILAAVSMVVFVLDRFVARGALDVIWISGAVFTFCFWRYWGNFGKYGDFSYGVYIVHWPIIQILITLGLSRWNPGGFLFVSLTLILAAAVLLWFLVERPFLIRTSHYRAVSIAKAR